MKKQSPTEESWIMNRQAPLSVTLSLPGISQTFNSRMVYLLKQRDGFDRGIERKWPEFEKKIQALISDLFSCGQIVELESRKTLSPMLNGPTKMDSNGRKVVSQTHGGKKMK